MSKEKVCFKIWIHYIKFIGGLYCSAIASNAGQDFLSFGSEAILAFSILGFVYPIPFSWIHGQNGWLKINGFDDFGESGLVHLVGGMFGLGLSMICKPRPGRFPRTMSFWANKTPGKMFGNFKNSRPKKFVKSNKSISWNIFFDQIPFFAISKMAKYLFLNWEKV